MIRFASCAIILIAILLVIFSFPRSGVYSILSAPPKVPPYLAWHYAKEDALSHEDIELISAFFRSATPIARQQAIDCFSDLAPSEASLLLLFTAFSQSDHNVKYHAMHGIYNISECEGIDMRREGIIFPAYQRYQNDPDAYLKPWQSWIASNRERLLHNISSLSPQQAEQDAAANP